MALVGGIQVWHWSVPRNIYRPSISVTSRLRIVSFLGVGDLGVLVVNLFRR
uniref:Uncharacterized protein n=1 Tax=Meloidogyne enterolobii TaxID=390850 RepID=A0A6V7VYJ3_MELEN|nr:unnamed protein product [Meloidogyne enterolobii]